MTKKCNSKEKKIKKLEKKLNTNNLSKEQTEKARKKLTLRGVLLFLVALTIIRSAFEKEYESVFMGVLTILMFMEIGRAHV